MSYDTNRSTIVIFGGLSVYAAQENNNVTDNLLSDTWEHLDTSTPETQPTQVTVASIVLIPNSVTAVQINTVTAKVTLTGPAPGGGLNIPFGVVPKTAYDNSPASAQILPITLGITIPVNETSGQIQLPETLGAVETESFYLFCLYDPTGGSNYAYALLTIIPT
jgi:hypothetical protein